jgi:formate--tetrahydrofolate ligase
MAGAEGAYVSTVWAEGGAGGAELAEAVAAACDRPAGSRGLELLYPGNLPVKDKIAVIAQRLYGAASVTYEPAARKAITHLTHLGLGALPVCIAKTHLSLSHDPHLLGAPAGYQFPVHDVRASAGAGFVYALCGDVRTMPGLPSRPAFEQVDLVDGRVTGLR